MRVQQAVGCAGVLALGLLAGCGKSGGGSGSGKSSGGAGEQGKTYAPDGKAAKGGSGASSAPASNAETVDGKPSAASDDGALNATKGRPVNNPGAPAPQPTSKPSKH